MRIGIAVAAVAVLGAGAFALLAARAPELPGKTNDKTGSIRLHNGWRITPVGTVSEKIGDTLLGCALSPDGKTLAIANAGAQAHFVHLFDTATSKFVGKINVGLTQSGLAWSPDGKTIYASGGIKPEIHVFTKAENGEYGEDSIPLLDLTEKGSSYLSGMAISKDGRNVYIANLANDTVYSFDPTTKKVRTVRRFDTGARPGCLRMGANGRLYVALWAKAQIAELDGATLDLKRTLATGKHPNDLLFSTDNSRLFVSCGNSDAVFVHDAVTGNATEQIHMGLTLQAPPGATPSALALSPDGKTLFVPNADNNDVAVVDVAASGQSRVRGFIPTAQYPTIVAVSPDGKRLFIGSGKGTGTGPNNILENGKIDPVAPRGYPYITLLLSGVMQTVEIPTEAKLAEYTKMVLANTPYTSDAMKLAPAKAPKSGTNPIPSRVGEASPIKHILYIIKENRTYDQVFGDMKDNNGKPIGNGDPNLTLFGEDVSPNHHELARQFVLLDNTYCDGEVSVDGHQWSKGGYVTDFMQRTWPSQYGGKGAPPLTEELSDNPGGYIWDICEKAGISYRTYYYHTTKNRSVEWSIARGKQRDYEAVDVFFKELDEYEKNKNLPGFMVMALSEDHTAGTTPGRFTPKAAVGSNDYGLGKIVARMSKSPYWKETAIFVIEDDAQNGPDHVDAHRTAALVISPYTRRGTVDSTFYTTSSLLRTMELILGLQPMSQYDASATPMYNAFTNKPDLTPYTVVSPKIALEAKNPPRAIAAARMKLIDFSEPDQLTAADEDALNRALWHSIKGIHTPYPGTTRRALMGY